MAAVVIDMKRCLFIGTREQIDRQIAALTKKAGAGVIDMKGSKFLLLDGPADAASIVAALNGKPAKSRESRIV